MYSYGTDLSIITRILGDTYMDNIHKYKEQDKNDRNLLGSTVIDKVSKKYSNGDVKLEQDV